MAKRIKKIAIPKLLCDSVSGICRCINVEVRYYSTDLNFEPENIILASDEWLYIVNYYGQINNNLIKKLKEQHKRIIVDNAQAYFQMPIAGIDTLYTCRKFFGVPDGAFLYTDSPLNENFPQDESFERMRFILGRFERTASEFYDEYVENNKLFSHEPIKRMSKLTNNLLHGIDYEFVKKRRTENFAMFYEAFGNINGLQLTVPDGAFMYPLYIENGAKIRKKLQLCKIYIPTLWPGVFDVCDKNELEYDMAMNILPLPVDQRYNNEAMRYVINNIIDII